MSIFSYIDNFLNVIGIVDFVKRIINKFGIPLSIIGTLLIISVIVFIVVIIKNHRFSYDVRKIFCYFIKGPRLSFMVKEKSSCYIFKSRTKMDFERHYTLLALKSGFQIFSDKFRWSKTQATKDFKLKNLQKKSKDKIELEKDGTWNKFNVKFAPVSKGEKKQIDISIYDLDDPEKESCTYLSCFVNEKTAKIKLKVELPEDLTPINIVYSVYNSQASDNSVFDEKYSDKKHKHIVFDESENSISVIERYPIVGYKYRIDWDFKEDIESSTNKKELINI